MPYWVIFTCRFTPGHNRIKWGVGVWSKYTVGEILWVRETFALHHWSWHNAAFPVKPHNDLKYDESEKNTPNYCYIPKEKEADCIVEYWSEYVENPELYRWRPSIHMPRWASRITLKVTNIRVERLNDITEQDAQDEGILMDHTEGYYGSLPGYIDLWDSLNAKRGFSWDSNPWVWVYTFEKAERTIRERD
jgi:hypothetical protein